jgi:hypothetical protein
MTSFMAAAVAAMSVCTGTKALAVFNGANADTPATKTLTTKSLGMRNSSKRPRA